ncbi:MULTISPECIES: hypothetical protein [unclassified Streptomyces]|uniref:hypothetical protein n=1 Tax=unclassified Streptomyces TaxID=2593676 RepID=UPI00364901B6
MKHPADFLASVLRVSPRHADVADLSAARTGPWAPPPVPGRVLAAAAVRPGEK